MLYGKTQGGSIVIGLSERNLELLKQGKPIKKECLGVMPDLIIVYGKTEQVIYDMLTQAGMIDMSLTELQPVGTKQ
jgi:hypothetical protein